MLGCVTCKVWQKCQLLKFEHEIMHLPTQSNNCLYSFSSLQGAVPIHDCKIALAYCRHILAYSVNTATEKRNGQEMITCNGIGHFENYLINIQYVAYKSAPSEKCAYVIVNKIAGEVKSISVECHFP